MDDDKCHGEKHKNNESYGESKDRLRGGAVTEELIGNLILEQSPEGGEETNMRNQIYRMRTSSTFTTQCKTGFFLADISDMDCWILVCLFLQTAATPRAVAVSTH